ncbi:MAG: folate-binding protein YgfZ [Pseudomonadales bacterium]
MSTEHDTADDWACLSIVGSDSRKFLQGQLSNDTDLIGPEKGGFFALCTPKGRTLANFFIIQQPGGAEHELLIACPQSSSQIVLDTLAKYIVFSKAELSRSENWQIGLVKLTDSFPYDTLELETPSAEAMAASQNESSAALLRVSKESELALVFTCQNSPTAEHIALSANDSTLAFIRAGIGLVNSATSDEFVPQMLNMQLNNGISFTKGCYTGQEIVARSQYRGKIKRRMYRAKLETVNETPALSESPIAGTEVADQLTGKSLGKVVSSAINEDGGLELLLVLGLKEQGDQIPTIADSALEILSLPYSFESATEE